MRVVPTLLASRLAFPSPVNYVTFDKVRDEAWVKPYFNRRKDGVQTVIEQGG